MNDPDTMDTDPEGLAHLWANLAHYATIPLDSAEYSF